MIMKNKGVSKPLWIIAIVFVIFLIGGIAVLIAPTAPAEVTVTTGEVTDHDLTTSIKATLEGEKDSYSLSMTGPEGTEVGSAYITETQMADGKQSVWIPLVGDYKTEVAAKPGAYSLVVTDSFGNKVYEKTLGPYSGSELSIINISTTSTPYTEPIRYDINSISLTCRNNGDLPAYVTGVETKIDKRETFPTAPEVRKVILPSETVTITAELSFFGTFDEGDYSATVKLEEGFLGQGKTVATYTTTISIP